MSDLCHWWKCAHEAFDSGKMDGFLKAEGSQQTFGYYNATDIPYYWSLAKNYTLFDNYFTSVMGGSFPNHLYLIAGKSGGVTGRWQGEGFLFPTIFDKLGEHNVSWRYYAAGYQYVNGWNPLPAFLSYGRHNWAANMGPSEQIFNDLSSHNLASITYVMPPRDDFSDHPPYSLNDGQNWVKSVVTSVQSSSYWNSTAILLTWDDYGGWYDHVAPPQLDGYGYGFRVPMILVSPFSKGGGVDHTLADHASILRFAEETFHLGTLNGRDKSAYDLMNSFSFNTIPEDETYTISGAPALYSGGPVHLFNVTFTNNQFTPKTGIAFAVLRNPLNQTIAIGVQVVSAQAGTSQHILFGLHGLQRGTYSIDIFVIAFNGFSISRPIRIILTLV